MSIVQCLAERVHEGRLFEIRPLLPSSKGGARSVWAEMEVFRSIQLDTSADNEAAGRMRRKLEGIAAGNRLVIGNRGDKSCDLKRLDPPDDEVWEIRECVDPSVRIFFRFVQRDQIAATNIRFVRDLFGVVWLRRGLAFLPVWRTEIRRCKAIWRQLFLTFPPHQGSSLDDYVTNATGSGAF